MNITGDLNIFIRNIIGIMVKGCVLNKGVILNGTLYCLVNDGILYEIDLSSYMNSNIICTFNFNSIKYHEDMIPDVPELYQDMCKIINTLNWIKHDEIYVEPDCRSDEQFENIINSKATDGSYRYYIDTRIGKNFMTLYKPLFNLTKTDKCSLTVYDTTEPFQCLADFIIHKQKIKMDYHMKFVYMDLISYVGGNSK